MLYEVRAAASRESQAIDADATPARCRDEIAFRRALNESRHDNFTHIAEDLFMQLVLRQLACMSNEPERRKITGTESAVTGIRAAPRALRLSTCRKVCSF